MQTNIWRENIIKISSYHSGNIQLSLCYVEYSAIITRTLCGIFSCYWHEHSITVWLYQCGVCCMLWSGGWWAGRRWHSSCRGRWSSRSGRLHGYRRHGCRQLGCGRHGYRLHRCGWNPNLEEWQPGLIWPKVEGHPACHLRSDDCMTCRWNTYMIKKLLKGKKDAHSLMTVK